MDNSRAMPAVDETAVWMHDGALAVVQRLLNERGIRAWLQHTLKLELRADREADYAWPDAPPLRIHLERYAPELVVTGAAGAREATIVVGPDAAFYLVLLRCGSLHTVESQHPEQVADLITAAEAA
ncbi:hypothetical protein FHS43_004461 [Streptosporangium becharense]|uniref:Uncharacterized protein n=1 Tax=Streptosporangium becharense TaxID=1816182 RepID=A0A7W9MJ06_9ACTN|nr:hypothetical protein [Streptosporangium becharense]MBB2913163.1 hypothetical protein [Streptosporangium becharense]MBB5822146.1 hypothetical protein [Streptosporangium becharense]